MRRRQFLWGGAGVVGVGSGLATWLHWRKRVPEAPDNNLVRDPEGILDLPKGFRYQILERAGDPMDDGFRVPALPDGMACFEGNSGQWVLMRNHEVDVGMLSLGPFPQGSQIPAEAYNPQAGGGVTRVVIDSQRLKRVSSNLVLAGTARNCAGGPSPWGWLSCEESESPGHGYVFVCPTDAAQLRPARRVLAYGRFNHEAVAIAPGSFAAYLTEDKVDGCLYRMQPDDPQKPFEGSLTAMTLDPDVSPDTGQLTPGRAVRVHWRPIAQPVPREGDPSTRQQARAQGCAVVRRGEGIWWQGPDSAFFCATIGGPAQLGQVFELRTTTTGQWLRVIALAEDPSQLDMPDNLTVAPWGELFVCEDGAGTNHLRRISRGGKVQTFARNAASKTELAGVCFSPDGRALFVNVQHEGLTLMVTGPFERYAALEV